MVLRFMWQFGVVKKEMNMRPKETNISHPNRLDFCFRCHQRKSQGGLRLKKVD